MRASDQDCENVGTRILSLSRSRYECTHQKSCNQQELKSLRRKEFRNENDHLQSTTWLKQTLCFASWLRALSGRPPIGRLVSMKSRASTSQVLSSFIWSITSWDALRAAVSSASKRAALSSTSFQLSCRSVTLFCRVPLSSLLSPFSFSKEEAAFVTDSTDGSCAIMSLCRIWKKNVPNKIQDQSQTTLVLRNLAV